MTNVRSIFQIKHESSTLILVVSAMVMFPLFSLRHHPEFQAALTKNLVLGMLAYEYLPCLRFVYVEEPFF